MPTLRPRLTITETDDVAQMLDEAAERWPADREHRARLFTRLARLGVDALRRQQTADRISWEERVRGAAGAAGPQAYPAGYLDRLRGDWQQ